MRDLLLFFFIVAASTLPRTTRAAEDRSYTDILVPLSSPSTAQWSDPAWVYALASGRCTSKEDTDACGLAAILLYHGHGTPTDTGGAFEQLDQICAQGLPHACAWRAWMLATGSGIGPDPIAAVAEMKRSCDAGMRELCAITSVSALRSPANAQRIRSHQLPEADLPGLGPVMADIQSRHANEQRVSDPAAAVPALAAACSVKVGDACVGLIAALEATGGLPDALAAPPSTEFFDIWLLQRACKAGVAGTCEQTRSEIAGRQEAIHEWLVSEQGPRARRAWMISLGCAADNATACAQQLDRASRDEREQLLRRAVNLCSADAVGWCLLGAQHHPDYTIRTSLGGMACSSGSGEGCYHAARGAKQSGDADNQLRYLKKGCNLQHTDACSSLAWLMSDAIESPLWDQESLRSVLDQGCAQEDPMSCLVLGRRVWLDGDVAAPELLGQACALGKNTACGERLIIEMAAGRGGEEDIAALMEFPGWWSHPRMRFQEGMAEGLYETGRHLASGGSLQSSPPGGKEYATMTRALGRALLSRSCDEGYPEACALYEETSPQAIAARAAHREAVLADPAQWEGGCTEGIGRACFLLAETTNDCFTKMPLLFQGCTRDEPAACAAWAVEIIIQNNHPTEALVSSGSCAENTSGTEHPPSQLSQQASQALHAGVSGLTTACARGDAEACHRLGRLRGGLHFDTFEARTSAVRSIRSDKIAVEALERACEGLGPGEACIALGQVYESGHIGPKPRTHSFPRDQQRAAALYSAACEAGDTNGCVAGAWQAWRHGDRRDGLDRLLAACQTTHPDVCYPLAHQLRDKTDFADVGAAAEQSACEQGFTDSCHELGVRLESGRGVTRDPSAALAAFSIACKTPYEAVDLGDRPSGASSVPEACLQGALLLSGSRGLPASAEKQRALLRRGCRRSINEEFYALPPTSAEARACALLDAAE